MSDELPDYDWSHREMVKAIRELQDGGGGGGGLQLGSWGGDDFWRSDAVDLDVTSGDMTRLVAINNPLAYGDGDFSDWFDGVSITQAGLYWLGWTLGVASWDPDDADILVMPLGVFGNNCMPISLGAIHAVGGQVETSETQALGAVDLPLDITGRFTMSAHTTATHLVVTPRASRFTYVAG